MATDECAKSSFRRPIGRNAAEQQASQALPSTRLSSEEADGSPSRMLIDWSADAELLVLGAY